MTSLRALWPSPGIVQAGLLLSISQEHQGNTTEFRMHIIKWVRLSTSHPSAGSNFVWMTFSWIRDIELQLIWMSSSWTWDIKLELNSSCTALVDGKLQHWAKLCIFGQGDTLQTSHNYLLHSHISRFTWWQVASKTTLKCARTTSSRTLTDPGFSTVLRVA